MSVAFFFKEGAPVEVLGVCMCVCVCVDRRLAFFWGIHTHIYTYTPTCESVSMFAHRTLYTPKYSNDATFSVAGATVLLPVSVCVCVCVCVCVFIRETEDAERKR